MKTFSSLANPEYETQPFTDFSRVTPRTDISKLNFNWRENDLRERDRTKHVHRLHPYLGKFIPQLVEIFLRKFAKRAVCDPFSGSGTTIVEATTLGLDAVGVDVSTFNCLLAKVKTDKYDVHALEVEAQKVLSAFDLAAEGLFADAHGNGSKQASEYLRLWYHPLSLRELLLFRKIIGGLRYEDLFKVVLCRAARSARLAPHHELDNPDEPVLGPYACRKHFRTCRPTVGAAKFVRRYLLDTLERVRAYAELRRDVHVCIKHGDARQIELPAFDTIVTSPPYVGLIDYHEQHRYAYELLGLPRNDDWEIGPAKGGASLNAKERYRAGIIEVFRNCAESLAKGGNVVVVVGDRHDLYRDMHKDCGFKLMDRFERHVNRRTGRRNSDFFESILVWRR
ncbi:MAG: class I SAM-dependent methyltransferase [Elusimicrobia bacterium]|nr:class I SAM-dependent methyltransferase [Elusimicrobiota bacterium]